jgi:tetratricopeptide (TPR) repeat protein
MKSGIIGFGRLAVGALAATLMFGLSLSVADTTQAAAVVQQEPGGRFRVLVAPLDCRDQDRRFGEKVAKEVSARLEDFSTHAPIPDKEFKRALKRYEVKEEELNAIKARQLANLMGAQVVYWGACSGAGTSWDVEAGFIDVTTGDQVSAPAIKGADKSDDSIQRVAEISISTFEEQVRFVRARQFCADYVGSQQPENALRNCNEALEINPKSVHTLLNKGLAFRQLFETEEVGGTNGWADSAVVYFQRVLEQDPGRREALQNAAYMYSQMGDAGKASELYRQYLELDPGNVPIRLKVANDLAQVGLMREAIDIIQAGQEYAENDVNLLQFLGDYALRYSAEDSSYVDVALEAYEKVLEVKGEETDIRIIENALAAYTAAGRTDEAIVFAERALESHSDSPRLWSLYADALSRADRFTDASAAMDQVLELDPAYANGYLKRAQFKLQAGDQDGAAADVNSAIQSGISTEEDAFRLFFTQAINARNSGSMSQALPYFESAARFAPAKNKQEVEFWWGYTNYQLGERLAEPEDQGLSQLQRAERYFQAAQQHFRRAGNVRAEVPQLLDGADRWLLNVEARIKQIQR